jgi:hypothetical protein
LALSLDSGLGRLIIFYGELADSQLIQGGVIDSKQIKAVGNLKQMLKPALQFV